ncbi:MAG: amino acid permease C-terminal domain-containing protein [Steroidobacteraceae bacterium]
MLSLGTPTWWRLVIWTVIGVIIYVVYGYRHSRVRAENGSATAAAAAR